MTALTSRQRRQPVWALGLAVAATGTALCMSVLAGWQRGGWLAERLVWVATGAVLVIGAHLLPALCRSSPVVVRCIAVLLWAACMVAASYGHATFFLFSQQHAGDVRAETVSIAGTQAYRSLTSVTAERVGIVTVLARANASHCTRDCPQQAVRRVSLAARRDALDAEADDIRRQQTLADRQTAMRESRREDPVTSRLADLFAVPAGRIDLFVGLAFAAVLEGVACLLWWIALQAPVPVTASYAEVTADSTVVTQPVAPLETEITSLIRDIEAGHLRPTVSEIRRRLSCSQAKAAALRRQFIASRA